MALHAASFATSASLLFLVACGGSPDSGLFGPGTGAGGSTGGVGASTGGAPGGGGAAHGTGGGAISGGGPGAGGFGGAGAGGASAGGSAGGGGETSAGGSSVPDASVEAGAGGTSPADGGAGGASGDGGAGGNVAAGGADAGGEPPRPTDGFVRCGTETCDLDDGEVCCTTSSGPGGTRSECARDTDACSRVFACDNHGDCGVAEQCCLTYPAVSLSPSSTCQPAGCEIPVECGSSADCARGETCCGLGTTVTGGTLYSAIACQVGTCNGDGDYTLCHGGVTCPDGTSCEASSHFPPGYPVCK